jgi:hypothetical protein
MATDDCETINSCRAPETAHRTRVLAVVRQHGLSLATVEDGLKADLEVVLEAVLQDGRALRHAAAELRSNRLAVRMA